MNQIIHSNCLTYLNQMADNCIDLTVTSPPYDDLRNYEGYSFEFKKVAEELFRVTKPGGVLVWVVGDQTKDGDKSGTSFKQALYFKLMGFKLYDIIIYEKAGTAPPHKNRYSNAFEFMFVFSKGKPKTVNLLKDKPNKWAGSQTFGEVTRREKNGSLSKKGVKTISDVGIRTNIWRYSSHNEDTYEHPAIFPLQLAKDHILSWSNEGDLVLDPFLGSGTTAKSAQALNRKYIGIEISTKYIKIAKERLKQGVLL